MASVKDAIEEIIEESYLLGLSEAEIREDFRRFIDTCYAVIEANIRNREAISGLAEDLAREKTCILIADHSGEEETAFVDEGGDAKDAQEVFAEKVARRKRMILKAIADFDPQLVRLIDEQRFQGEIKEIVRPKFKLKQGYNWEHHRQMVLRFGYGTTVFLIMLLIYLGFIQNP